jgi:hypothetical protein
MVSLDFFIDIILPDATLAMGSTKPLTEISTRNISWGKGSRCEGLTALLPSSVDCHKIWEPQPAGSLRALLGVI